MRNAVVFIVLALIVSACGAPSTPLSAPTSAATTAPSDTPEPTLTLTPTVTASPEPTLSPTAEESPTPEATMSLTPTFLFTLPSQTPTTTTQFDCDLVMQSPANGAVLKPREHFTAGWKLQNTGTVSWNPGSVEFTYVAGTKMYQDPLVHLTYGVNPGDSTVLSVDMRAPVNSTTYTTSWALKVGKIYFCRVRLTIYVQEP